MLKKVVGFGIALLAIVAVFVGCATYDSCQRHKDTRPCFGSSPQH